MEQLQKPKYKTTTFLLDPILYKRLKAKLVLESTTMTDWLRRKIREELNEY